MGIYARPVFTRNFCGEFFSFSGNGKVQGSLRKGENFWRISFRLQHNPYGNPCVLKLKGGGLFSGLFYAIGYPQWPRVLRKCPYARRRRFNL